MTDINTIKCPNCGEMFEPSLAFRHQMEEVIQEAQKTKHKEELEAVKNQTEKIVAARIKSEQEAVLKQLQTDSAEEKERVKRLLKQLEDNSEQMRVLRRKDEERELEMRKKLADEEEKIRSEVRAKTLEEHDLKDREKENKLTDALKQIEELKTKIQQGSQQSQGESLELELEESLHREFPMDTIEEVKKGQRGADIVQRVVDKKGRECGTILWESKNAQWSQTWISKLKEDQRQAKAHIAVLAVTDPPEKLKTFAYVDGVWIVLRSMAVSLALALRYTLVSLNFEKMVGEGKNEKMEVLYNYINSIEFRSRIESIREVFSALQKEIEREKQYFQTKWARQEKQLGRVLGNMDGMYGDLQGIVGQNLPDIKVLESSIVDDSSDSQR
jgi:hypothetical protein